ncbi:MAG: hypothetical protein R6U38_01665 [Desulfatiglandaceae bacterium]
MPDREIQLKGFGVQLEEWENKLADLKAKARESKTPQSPQYLERIERLQQKTDSIRKSIQETEGKAEIDWETERQSFEHAFQDLDEEYRQVWVHFYH